MRALLSTFSMQELRHHPWRNAAAVVAVMLGVALAFSVHLINASALSEFSQAVRAVNGQPDLELRAAQGSFDEALYARVANDPQVEMASPVLEISSYALNLNGDSAKRQPLRIVGIDALAVASVAPALMPVPFAGPEKSDTTNSRSNSGTGATTQAGGDSAGRFAIFAPNTVFLNPAARQLFNARELQLQDGLQLRRVTVAGSVSAGGGPLAVMDIGAAQELFGRSGQLSRIDVRLKPGSDMGRFVAALQLPPGISASAPGDAAERISNLSRAYRVNLTVLALVALFTGAFLVFSVLSLSVAKRAQQFALLGVLGLTGRERLQLVLIESLALGFVGSVAGIALGTGLAALALRLLGGDLGGGYFAGVAPTLQWSGVAALTYGALGVAAAGVGGWWPARAAQKLPPAQTLKGLGLADGGGAGRWLSLFFIAAGGLLALLPPVFGIPLAAYFSVGLLLVGGITGLPWLITLLYDRLSPWVAHRLLPLLAVERARRVRTSAAVAISGVVASLSLAVALTVMVASFRDSVTHWLDVVLPADLYVRSTLSSSSSDAGYFSPEFVQAAARLRGVARVSTLRSAPLLLDADKPAVTLISRPLDDPASALPLIGPALPVPPGHVGIYVSEAMVDLYGARPGSVFAPLAQAFGALAQTQSAPALPDSPAAPTGPVASTVPTPAISVRPAASPAPEPTATATPRFYVAGVWRDYARQFGAIALAQQDFERLTGDQRVSDLALWLNDAAD